jgi:initiation factor 1A
MVKNFGGCRTKKVSRKHVNIESRENKYLRMSEDVSEMYAVVIKLFGNGMCNVKCLDGKERLCIIRKKFKGRNKRHNLVASGIWVLVGLREWETVTMDSKKPQKCDLLEVYSNADKEKLKKNEDNDYFKIFLSTGNENISTSREFNEEDCLIEFESSREGEYESLLSNSKTQNMVLNNQEEASDSSPSDFDIDDI